ncbi:hypothetical protein P3X46_020695 [Hevea brasiliensis]|uniref:Retrotransposon gag domain-containing protein n=1 Tax=Hevea brasiliensis TaxID=3981 RepID=A0ABQ9LGX5_HEVBR|nr:hypothetical protein P3X46_020695 [Hevea brasiliensis]
MKEFRGAIAAEISSLKEDVVVCKAAVSAGVTTASVAPKVKVPEPPKFGDKRDAKELDNFIWLVEQYLDALHVVDDSSKIKNTTLYLDHDAILWWRRCHAEMERGLVEIRTWEAFKGELKKQFYPENAEEVAMKKLRGLKHTGSLKDYIREYSSLMLEIPDMPNKSRLLYFLDGLQQWAEQELKRRGVQDLASAIAVAESLLEFSKRQAKKEKSKKGNYGKGGGDKPHKAAKPFKPKEKQQGEGSSKDWPKPKNDCFLCGGPHCVRECPNQAKLNAIAFAYEGTPQQGEAAQLGTLRVLNTVQAKVATGETTKARQGSQGRPCYSRCWTQWANQNLVSVEEATRLGLKVAKEPGCMKAVDQLAKPLFGVAHGVPLQLGNWAGIVDLSVVPLKDFQLVIGLDFMERVLPFSLTEDGCMTFRSAGHDYTVAVERQPVLGGVLLAMQVAKGVKKGEKTFLVAYKEEGTPSNSLDISHDVSKLFQEFSDMMPSELPKKLPPRREVDHAIKLEPGAKPPAIGWLLQN